MTSILLGNGDGTFQAPQDTAGGAGDMAVGDFNGDGTLELDGMGNFSLAADLNQDGILDLIGFQYSGNAVSVAVYLGNGDGTFQSPLIFPTGIQGGAGMAIGDIDGDGKLDLAVAGQEKAAVSILRGHGDGTLENAQLILTTYKAGGTVMGDFNADGKLDLVVLNQRLSAYALTVLLQGNFAAVTLAPTSVTFDPQAPGTTSPIQQITLTNSGNAPLTISNIAISGTNAGDFAETNTCPVPLAAGQSCHINVTFTPQAVSTRTATLTVTDDAPGSQQSVALSGTVQGFTIASVPPTSQTVTAGQAANYSVTVPPGLGFAGTVNLSCSGAPANSTCTVTPDSLPGTGTANVAVATHAPSGAFVQEVGWAGLTSSGVALIGVFGVLFLVSGTWYVRFPRLGKSALLCCVLSIPFWTGCGGGGGHGGGGGTLTGTYTLKVTGTYTAGGVTVNHSTNFTLVVK